MHKPHDMNVLPIMEPRSRIETGCARRDIPPMIRSTMPIEMALHRMWIHVDPTPNDLSTFRKNMILLIMFRFAITTSRPQL